MSDPHSHKPALPDLPRPDAHGRRGRFDARDGNWKSPTETGRAAAEHRALAHEHAKQVLADRAAHGDGWHAGQPLRDAPVSIKQRQTALLGEEVAEAVPQLMKNPRVRAVAGLLPGAGTVAAVVSIDETYHIVRQAAAGELSWKKAGAELASKGVALAGGLVGFGAGELGQDAVHHASRWLFGDQHASAPSATSQTAHELGSMAGAAMRRHRDTLGPKR